jgi:hypothetical protein
LEQQSSATGYKGPGWLSGRAHPQMLLRFGATDEITASVRRPVEEVLL